MPSRVSPTDRMRADIDALFTEDRDLAEVLEDVARLGARLILQTTLEAGVTEFLGRDRYARGPCTRAGSRNGYAPTTVKTTAEPVELARPKLRGTDTAFASRLPGKHVTKTHALESLVIAGYVRGLSTRDVEASLADALGPEATLSKSTVSRVCAAIRDEFDGWRRRDLADVELEYLYLGRLALRLPRRRTGRDRPVRLGYHHHRRTDLPRARRRQQRIPRRLCRVPARPGGPWAATAAVGHHRRRARG